MNVNEIIEELRNRKLIDDIPEEHIINHKEKKYEKFIEKAKYYPFSFERRETVEWFVGNENVDQSVLISNGNVEFPEIDTEEIGKELADEGIEAFAWYRSFHWNPSYKWGIYMVDKGIYYIARNVFGKIKQVSPQGRCYNTLDFVQQSFRLLFLHEFFHYITDIAASILEIGSLSTHPYYNEYVKNVYMCPRNKNEPVEEAMANAFAFNKFRESSIRQQLRIFMKNQPAGYSALEQYVRRRDFIHGRRKLGTLIRDGAHANGVAPLETLFDCYSCDLHFGDVPIYIIPTIKDSKYVIKLITSIPRSTLIQSPTFKKDLKRLSPDIIRKYQKALQMLEYNAQHRGLKFEKIKGCDTVFTVRIDRNYRISMRPLNGKWELLRFAEHDEVYRNPGGC
ncbi:MAG TPA: hypothetical protein ENI52_05400 [Thermoplasmata archaeon]|nr:hypothetical protein [Thermoplasmata archaeon]